jgi:hypothetical protein
MIRVADHDRQPSYKGVQPIHPMSWWFHLARLSVNEQNTTFRAS